MAPPTNKTNPAVYLLAGTDGLAVKKAAVGLTEKLQPEDPMNFEIIDAQVDRAEEAVAKIASVREALLTLPFFGGGKLVWWKNVNCLDDSPLGRNEGVLEALEGLLPILAELDPALVRLIISLTGVDKRRSFTKALIQLAEAGFYDLPDLRREGPEEAVFQIESRLKDAGLKPGEGVAERLFEATGLEPYVLAQEIEKLGCFHGDNPQPVTLEELQQIVSGRREVVIWDFCEAVLAGQMRQALDGLHQLLRQEESEVGILILLGGQVRMAALASVLMEAGEMKLSQRGSFVNAELTPRGQELLPRKKTGEPVSTFMLAKAGQKAKRLPARFWVEGVARVLWANQELLSGTADRVRVLERVVMEIAGGRRA